MFRTAGWAIGLGAMSLVGAVVVLALTSPPTVPWALAACRLAAITSLAGLIVGLIARAYYRSSDQPAVRATWAGAVVILVMSTGLTIRAMDHLSTGRQLSATLVRPAPELGPGAAVLRAGLKQATVIAPDRPHAPEEVTAPDRWERMTRRRTFTVTTNSQGLRSPEIAKTKSGPRILCIGDSVTMGWGVSDDQTYPATLAKLSKAEVINAGMPAMKPSTIAGWLRQHASSIQPDILVLAVRPNHAMPDPWQDYENMLRGAIHAVSPAKILLVLTPISTFDPLGSRVKATEAERINRLASGSVQVLDLADALHDERSRLTMKIEGAHQIMQMMPEGTVIAQGESKGDALLPAIIAAFEEDHQLQETHFFDGGHPDQAGYAIFAERVHEQLGALGWLPQQAR